MARRVTPSQLQSMLRVIRTKKAQAVDESNADTFLWSIIPDELRNLRGVTKT